MEYNGHLAILGGGNIGTAIAKGLVASGKFTPEQITITRRHVHHLESLKTQGFIVQSDNCEALHRAKIVIVAVRPEQLNALLREIRSDLDPGHHIVVSIVTGVGITSIKQLIGQEIPVIRAMPNTAIALCQSMTCLTALHIKPETMALVQDVFNALGQTIVIDEEQMVPATALCACGIAFFLRAIRAASQGGIEIGFHPDEALQIAAQTARGAAALVLGTEHHPEMEIDKVTTPRGCTIAGLNEMEHQGFSSAMIKGIKTSTEKAALLYRNNEEL